MNFEEKETFVLIRKDRSTFKDAETSNICSADMIRNADMILNDVLQDSFIHSFAPSPLPIMQQYFHIRTSTTVLPHESKGPDTTYD